MDKWNERLKKSRKNKKMTLQDVVKAFKEKDTVSVQSLITYEKGQNYPKLNVLSALCKMYGVSSDYILFGKTESSIPVVPEADTLLCLYMLMHSKRISVNSDGNILIEDSILKRNMIYLNSIVKSLELSNYDAIEKLLSGLNKMAEGY